MISQEEVCIWFKNLEGYSRIELMCALLDSCLPLELRFLGTYLEYSAGKHYTHLQKWEKDANKSSLWLNGDKEDGFSNKTFRRKFCIFLALLHSHNRSIAVKLFDVLNEWEYISESEDSSSEQASSLSTKPKMNNVKKSFSDNVSFYNEMRLLFSMASLHPALDFSQRSNLRDKKVKFSADCKRPSRLSSSESTHNDENTKEESIKETQIHLNVSGNVTQADDKDESCDSGCKSVSSKPFVTPSVVSTTVSITSSVPTSTSITEPNASPIIPLTESDIISTVPLVSRNTAVPVTVQNVQQLSLLDNIYQMPPYRTPPMLLSRSAGGIHRPLEPQIPIQVNIPLQPVHCVVNNQQFIQNNISVHANNTPKSLSGNVFSPPDKMNETVLPNKHTLHKTNQVQTSISMVSSNVYTPRTLDSLSGMNFIPMATRKPFSGPPYGRFSKLVHHVGNDDSSLPSHVYSVSILKDPATSLSTITSIPTYSINRRCLSESDAHDKMNGSQEHLQNIINQQPVTYTTQMITVDQKTDSSNAKFQQYFNPLPTAYGSSPVYLSKYNHNFHQTLLNNNNANITENSVPNHTLFAYDSQHQQPPLQKHPVYTQQQQQQTQSSSNRVVSTNPIISQTLLPQQQKPLLAVSTNEDNQQPLLSPIKTLPTGLNGTYISGYFDSKGIRPNVLHELHHKYELSVNKNEQNAIVSPTKSLSIPAQPGARRPSSSEGKWPPDIIESPCSSPSQSPNCCSPVHSPSSRRKENHDIYSSTANWLKSIRLHKYSDILENYSFGKMKEMNEEDFKSIGLTMGASNKIKHQIDLLVSRGLKEFGNPENLINPDLPQSSGGSSNVSPASISPVGTKYLNAGVIQHNSSQTFNTPFGDDIEKEENPIPEASSSQAGVIEANHIDSDDEVFPTRRRSEQATCYNCGHVGHYGDECTEQTMESLTYIRYSFQLDYSRNTPDVSKNSTDSSTTTTSDSINR